MVKGAIFDLDGTLLDSMFIWNEFGNEYLRTFGIEPRENLAETFKTFTLEQAAEYFIDHYDIKLSVSEIVDNINNMVSKIYRTKVTLKPGVNDFLKRLHASGVKMCVATVTDRDIAVDILKRLKIYEYFSEIFTCAEIGCSKETPEIYRHALMHLGCKKEEMVVFEDAFYAIKTAKQDGFTVAAVCDLYEPRQMEMKEISDYYINDFESFCFERKMKTALTVAGSDSGGGAGIQADIKTMTMNGVYAMSVITALTAQNTVGVWNVQECSPQFLTDEIDAVFSDIYPDAVKIGMVSSKELIYVIADRLKHYKAKNIVLDPVMVSTSGSRLMNPDAVSALTEELFPLADLVTPNIPEAESLSGIAIKGEEDIKKVAKYISDKYNCAVLLKGGHGINDANDLLYSKGEFHWFCSKRIDNQNTHGTGCTLSSAIAANLAKGFGMFEAVKRAKEYISGALSAGLDLGRGSGPLMHNFDLKEKYTEERTV